MLDLKKWMAKVSAWIAGADERYVNITGDTMTGRLNYKISDIDTTQANNGVTANTDSSSLMFRDVNDRYTGFVDNIAYTSGNIGTAIYASNYDSSGNRKNNYLGVAVAKDGTQTYSVANPAAFRTTIGAVNKAGDTMTGNLVVSASDATTRNVKAENSTGGVYLNITGGGDHGVYSGTKSKWLVHCDTSGNVDVNGTPISTSAANTCNAFINALGTATATPVDADYYVSQSAGGGTTTTTYYRRTMSALWNYIKGKITANFKIVNVNANVSLGAGASGWVTVNKPSTGTPIAVVGYYLKDCWYLNIYNISLNASGQAVFALYNPLTSATASGAYITACYLVVT